MYFSCNFFVGIEANWVRWKRQPKNLYIGVGFKEAKFHT